MDPYSIHPADYPAIAAVLAAENPGWSATAAEEGANLHYTKKLHSPTVSMTAGK